MKYKCTLPISKVMLVQAIHFSVLNVVSVPISRILSRSVHIRINFIKQCIFGSSVCNGWEFRKKKLLEKQISVHPAYISTFRTVASGYGPEIAVHSAYPSLILGFLCSMAEILNWQEWMASNLEWDNFVFISDYWFLKGNI